MVPVKVGEHEGAVEGSTVEEGRKAANAGAGVEHQSGRLVVVGDRHT